jgi:hypothetical protein
MNCAYRQCEPPSRTNARPMPTPAKHLLRASFRKAASRSDLWHPRVDRLRSLRKRLLRIGANAADHGTKPIGALWREMFTQAEALEQRDRVGRQNLLRALAGNHRQQDGDQPADDMGVAVAGEAEHRPIRISTDRGREPDLAGATLHLVGVGTLT